MATVKNNFRFGCGVVIIILALIVFIYSIPAKFEMDPVRSDASYSPQKEADLEYGGDAYTGIQQAAAQGANNTYGVFEAIQIQNRNLIMQTKAIVAVLKLCFGFMLLAVGIALIAMSVEYDAYKPEERVYVPRTGIENATSTIPSPAPQAVSKVQAPAPRPVNIPQTETAEPEGWVCSCGKHHQFYVSACSCGKTKKEAKLEAHSQQN